MRPGWETAAGFFVGSVRGPDALEKWEPHSVFANRGVLLFFIVIFYRCLRETIEVDRARTSSGCRSGAKGLWARKKLMVPRRG